MTAKKPYYVVLMGRMPGIYREWDDVLDNTNEFLGSSYAKVDTMEKARSLFKSKKRFSSENEMAQTKRLSAALKTTMNIYVDGSYYSDYNLYSYAFLIVIDGQIRCKNADYDTNKEVMDVLGSQAAELKATMAAIQYAKKCNETRVLIYHDCLDIQTLARKKREPRNKYEKMYVDFIDDAKETLKIDFTKVKAHEKNIYNETVDKLAKQALRKPIAMIVTSKKKEGVKGTKKAIPHLLMKDIKNLLSKIPTYTVIFNEGDKKKIDYIRSRCNDKLASEKQIKKLKKFEKALRDKMSVYQEAIENFDKEWCRQMYEENYREILKYKKSLGWYGEFLIKTKDFIDSDKELSHKQKMHLKIGFDRLMEL